MSESNINIEIQGNSFTCLTKPKFKLITSNIIKPMKYYISLDCSEFIECSSDIFIPSKELSEGKHVINLYAEDINKEKSKTFNYIFDVNFSEVETPELVSNYTDFKYYIYFNLQRNIEKMFFYVNDKIDKKEFKNFCIEKKELNKYIKNGNNKIHIIYKNKYGKFSEEFVFDYKKEE